MTTQDNIFPIIIIILGVIAFLYFARNIYWWSIPNEIVMKSHLRTKSLTELEMRFQEAIKVNVTKAIMVTVFLMLFISTSIFYLTPIYEQQVSYKNLELVRDKEEYQKASDKGKETIIEQYFDTTNFKNTSKETEIAVKSTIYMFLIPLVILSYIGAVKKVRTTAIYEIINERENHKI